MLRFSDGVAFDTSGPFRIEARKDGLYVVGRGNLVAVKDREEGDRILKMLEEARRKAAQAGKETR